MENVLVLAVFTSVRIKRVNLEKLCEPFAGTNEIVLHTALSRKVVGKNVHGTIPKGNMGYDQCTVPESETVAVEPTFVAFF